MPKNKWSPQELAFVRENPYMDPDVLSDKIFAATGSRRNHKGVYHMQRRVVKGTDPDTGKSDASFDFDERPSGWYEETIGLLLLDYPDAMKTWAHYHRYVEIEHVNTTATGWVTLRCRRDADAP